MKNEFDTPLDVIASNGGFFIREVVRFALFVRRPHRTIAASVVRAIGHVIDAFPPPALSMFSTESGDWIDLDIKGLKSEVYKRLIGSDHPINASLSLSGGQSNVPDFQLDYLGYAIDRPAFRTSSCALWFQIGVSICRANFESALQVWEHLTSEVDASSGYVELALEGDQRERQRMARKYINEDISDVSCVSEDLEENLPGAYWRNYLGSNLANALGGADAISSALSKKSQIVPISTGGLLVTLGEAPSRGEESHQEALADRFALARLAHAKAQLSVPREVTYFEAVEGRSDSEGQEAWHLRHVL